jgi:hypothetical protein
MDVLDTLFGPVSKKYCSLFYYLMVGSFFVYSAMIIFAVVWGISHSKGIAFYAMGLFFAFMFFLMYFQIRLLYSMCVR